MATIQGVYVALFGRPADPAGLAFWNALTKNGADLGPMLSLLTETAEFHQRFEGLDDSAFVSQIYQTLFGREPEPAGHDFFVGLLTSGAQSRATIAVNILDGAQGSDRTMADAKLDAAQLFLTRLDLDDEVAAYWGDDAAGVGRAFLQAVTTTSLATDESADAAIARLFPDGGQVPNSGSETLNRAPLTSLADEDIVGLEDQAITGFLQSGSDPDGDPITYHLGKASGGIVVIDLDGRYSFTPDDAFNGLALFTYFVFDGTHGSAHKTVGITVRPRDASDFDARTYIADDMAHAADSDVAFNVGAIGLATLPPNDFVFG